MLRVFAGGERAGRSGEKIEVVGVVAGTGDDGMVAAAHEDGVSVFCFQCAGPDFVVSVKMLKREALFLLKRK